MTFPESYRAGQAQRDHNELTRVPFWVKRTPGIRSARGGGGFGSILEDTVLGSGSTRGSISLLVFLEITA